MHCLPLVTLTRSSHMVTVKVGVARTRLVTQRLSLNVLQDRALYTQFCRKLSTTQDLTPNQSSVRCSLLVSVNIRQLGLEARGERQRATPRDYDLPPVELQAQRLLTSPAPKAPEREIRSSANSTRRRFASPSFGSKGPAPRVWPWVQSTGAANITIDGAVRK